MSNYLDLSLESNRLKLIPASLNYAEEMCKEFTSEITKYMWPSAPKSQRDIKNHILFQQKKMEQGEELFLVIKKKDTEEFLGCAGFHQINSQTPELGIWLKKSAHGFNYGFEAINLLKNWAEENINYQYLKYPVARQNIFSRKIAEKMGGKLQDEYIKTNESGQLLDEVEYRFYKVRE